MNVIAELMNLANGHTAAGDNLAAKICHNAIIEIKRLQAAYKNRLALIEELVEACKEKDTEFDRLQVRITECIFLLEDQALITPKATKAEAR